jgi:hypothetical protein
MAPTAYFYDASGAQTAELELGDRTLTELLDLFSEKSFTPTLETLPYPETPHGSRDYGGHSYKFYNTENPKAVAEDFAQAQGGYVVTVTSAQEQAFLGKSLGELGIAKAWLGATDSEEEGTWKWSGGPEKGMVFSRKDAESGGGAFTFWFKGEPNNIDTEDCSNVFPDGWNDVSCIVEKAPLVIEIGNDPLQEPPVPEEEKKVDL